MVKSSWRDASSWYLQAEEIAEKLCESVAASLEGKKLGSFTRISSTVQVCYSVYFLSQDKLLPVAIFCYH